MCPSETHDIPLLGPRIPANTLRCLWAIEIKRTTAPTLSRGLRQAYDDIKPDRTFIVYGGDERYPKGGGVEVISLREMAEELVALSEVG